MIALEVIRLNVTLHELDQKKLCHLHIYWEGGWGVILMTRYVKEEEYGFYLSKPPDWLQHHYIFVMFIVNMSK